MQVPNLRAGSIGTPAPRKMGTSGTRRVFTDATLADRTVFVDRGGEDVLRLWLPGGIAIEDRSAFDWDVYLNATVDEQQNVVVTNLQVKAKAGGPGVTASRLRDLPFSAILDELLSTPPVAAMVRRGEGDPDTWEVVDREVPPEFLAEARRRTGTQRGRRADESGRLAVLADVAAIARAAEPGQMLRDLEARGYGKPPRAKKYLRAAREAGLLEHSSRSAPKATER